MVTCSRCRTTNDGYDVTRCSCSNDPSRPDITIDNDLYVLHDTDIIMFDNGLIECGCDNTNIAITDADTGLYTCMNCSNSIQMERLTK